MRRTIRFSIAGLMGVVLIVAIGLAALRTASNTWAGVIFLATCSVLALSIVGVICRRESERAWWLGFAIFGWGYMALAFWPSGEPRLPNLPTMALVQWLSAKLGLKIEGMAGGSGVRGAIDGMSGLQSVPVALMAGGFGGGGAVGYQAFEQVCHCLWALLFAVLGGTLASILFAIPPRDPERRHTETDSTGGSTWEGWLRPAVIGLAGAALIVMITVFRPRPAPGLAAGAIYLLTFGLLGLAVLGAVLGAGRPRQIWLGAALFGTGYMILAFGRDPVPQPTPYLPTDQLLNALRPWFPRMAGGLRFSSKVEAANARILTALDQPIPMRFPDETPLEDVLKYIRDATRGPDGKGIPIYVDPIGLQEAEKSLTLTVTVDLRGVPLGTTLNVCLKQLGLAFGVRDGFLMISSVESMPPPYEDPYLMGGHCVLALIAAAVGGVCGPLVSNARTRRSAISS